MLYILLFFLVLVGSIVLHEAGHFWTARRFGMKAERFFVGFGPTLWSTMRGETEVGVKAIPAGGFVKIAGMNRHDPVDPEDEPRAFYNKPAWQRTVVLGAGIFTHFVLATVLIWTALTFFEVPRFSDGEPVVHTAVGGVEPDSPAEAAGLELGDELLYVDGVPATDPDQAVTAIAERPGQTVDILVRRDGSEQALTATLPETAPDGDERGFLGITVAAAPQLVSTGPGEAVVRTFVGDTSVFTQTGAFVRALGDAFSPASLGAWLQQADGESERTLEGPVSLVGAGQLVGALGDTGNWTGILLLMIQIQIVVGFLNLLPLPPFDGGHLAQLLIETPVNKVREARGLEPTWEVSPAIITPVALGVLVLLLGFVATAFYIDIVNPASGPFR